MPGLQKMVRAVEKRSRKAANFSIQAPASVTVTFIFYQFAIEVMLEEKNWDGAIGYGQQPATYTEAEPLPWADFFIDRANALAAWGRGDRSADVADEIRRVQAVDNEAGITMTYPEVGAQ